MIRKNVIRFISLVAVLATPGAFASEHSAMEYLKQLVIPENGIGAREGGTEKEQKAANFVQKQFESMGLSVTVQPFKHPILQREGEFLNSSNIIAEKKGKTDRWLVLGAHFDSTAEKKGSQGAMDNGAGTSVMLAVAKQISELENLHYSIRFIGFGAEENGKIGSRYYMRELAKHPTEVAKIAGMVNLDTVAGGDFLYVHSAHTTPYKCGGDNAKYSSDTAMREAVLAASVKMLGNEAHKIHPEFPGYPVGVTGDWSDHESFSCNGIPIAYIETTNFNINGKDGYDGYSQSTDEGLWDCFDAENVTACNRETEKKWGRIWHEQHDEYEYLMARFPDRIKSQLSSNVKVLVEFFASADKYLK